MGRLKKAYNWLVERPRIAGIVTGAAFLPLSIKTALSINDPSHDRSLEDLLLTSITIVSPYIAYKGASIITKLLRNMTKEDPNRPRTKIGDRKTIKTLEAILLQRNPPTLNYEGSQTIRLLPTIFLSKYFNQNPADTEKLAQEQKNPALGIEAALRYFFKNQYDNGLLCLRDSTDWLKGKKPELSLLARLNFIIPQIALYLGRKTSPRHAEMYIFSAVLDSLLKPEHAWYYSALGREAANAFNLQLKKELYVFHALLATAQQRSDVEQAWKEAFAVLREQPYWERIGETRTLVRRLKNNQFFSHTLIFKEREDREQLELEAKQYETLGRLVPEVEVPQTLHITKEQHDGRYVYIMRAIEGETFYEQLTKGDKSATIRVICAMAKIHARMPTNLPRIPAAWKLRSKLLAKEFGINHKLAHRIIQNYRPVYAGFTKDALLVWNKDAHPENWIIGKRIGVVDCEAEHLIPATFDLANLLEYGNFFSQEEKRLYIVLYARELAKEGKQISGTNLMRAYYNSVIHRMLSLASAWSSPERKRMQPYRKEAITKAINAINNIAQEDAQYYESHKQHYNGLRTVLIDIQNLMPPYTS